MSVSMELRSPYASASSSCIIRWSRSARISFDKHGRHSARSLSDQVESGTEGLEVIDLWDTYNLSQSFNMPVKKMLTGRDVQNDSGDDVGIQT